MNDAGILPKDFEMEWKTLNNYERLPKEKGELVNGGWEHGWEPGHPDQLQESVIGILASTRLVRERREALGEIWLKLILSWFWLDSSTERTGKGDWSLLQWT